MSVFAVFGKSVEYAMNILSPRYERVVHVTPGMAFQNTVELKGTTIAAVVRGEDYDSVMAMGVQGVRVLWDRCHANIHLYVMMKDCTPVIKNKYGPEPWTHVLGDDMLYRGRASSQLTVREACGCEEVCKKESS